MVPPAYSSYMVKPFQGFSVVIGQTNYPHGKMILPKFFVDNYVEELSEAAIVSVPCGGCTWKLGVIKSTDGSVWFDEDGFEQFMSYYSIKLGYKLAFSYKGLSNFKVRIYTCEGSEINYYPSQNGDPQHHTGEADSSNAAADTTDPAAVADTTDADADGTDDDDVIVLDDDDVDDDDDDDDDVDDDVDDDDDDDDDDVDDDDDDYERQSVVLKPKRGRGRPRKGESPSSSNKKPKSPSSSNKKPKSPSSSNKKPRVNDYELDEEAKLLKRRLEQIGMVHHNSFYTTFPTLSTSSKRAVHEASLLKPSNPSFMVVLQASDVNFPRLCFPRPFWKKHMGWPASLVPRDIRIQMSGGSVWKTVASFKYEGSVVVYNCQGFLRENSLKEGDVCVFELLSAAPPALFKAYIVRAA